MEFDGSSLVPGLKDLEMYFSSQEGVVVCVGILIPVLVVCGCLFYLRKKSSLRKKVDAQATDPFTTKVSLSAESTEVLRDFNNLADVIQFSGPFSKVTAADIQETMTRDAQMLHAILTHTHYARYTNGNLDLVASKYRGSDTTWDPFVTGEWHLATGRWSETEAESECLGILERLDLLDFELGAVEQGNPQVVARAPSGEQVLVRPFHTVNVLNKEREVVAQFEFRIGSETVEGLTRLSVGRAISGVGIGVSEGLHAGG